MSRRCTSRYPELDGDAPWSSADATGQAKRNITIIIDNSREGPIREFGTCKLSLLAKAANMIEIPIPPGSKYLGTKTGVSR